eukprot:COSAG06_NODE_2451_length_6859_cov_3.705325_4_plen_197_part_01
MAATSGLAKMHRAWRPGTTVVAWEGGQLRRRKVSDYAFGEQYLHAGTGEGPARDTRWSEDTDVSVKHELTLTGDEEPKNFHYFHGINEWIENNKALVYGDKKIFAHKDSTRAFLKSKIFGNKQGQRRMKLGYIKKEVAAAVGDEYKVRSNYTHTTASYQRPPPPHPPGLPSDHGGSGGGGGAGASGGGGGGGAPPGG